MPEPSPSIPGMSYVVAGRDPTAVGTESLLVLPSVLCGEPDPTIAEHHGPILLPSAPSISELSSKAVRIAVQMQLSIVEELSDKTSASRMILRIPYGSRPDDLLDLIHRASEFGIRAVAVSLRGDLGPSDMLSVRARSVVPRGWMALALGEIAPSLVPLLYYLGFDGLDMTSAYLAAANGMRLWHNGSETVQDSEQSIRFCPCGACLGVDVGSIRGHNLVDVLTRHNKLVYRQSLSEAVYAMQRGTLRSLVESTSHYSTELAAFIRRLDRELYAFVEEFTPNYGMSTLPLIGPESYHSPVVRRFRERVASRYQPLPGKRLVILLPCSARKPYSESKSHHMFRASIDSAIGDVMGLVSETILTSPLGVVPRELERVFPVSRYDLPVTGDWDHEEIEIASAALVTHLSKFSSDTVVVAHVTGGYAQVVRNCESQVRQRIVYTAQGESTTSSRSLESLERVLRGLRDELDMAPTGSSPNVEAMRAVADFQMGAGAGPLLIPDGSRFRGRVHQVIRCFLESVQTCSFIGQTGSLSLTVKGAELLLPLGRYIVKFDGDRIRGGSLFAIGVTDADPDIRPGDEVIVVNREGRVV
ncbi:MAG: DUF5591 domain-containing protein, partial [Candidatus Thorarchaeota archaeon]